MSLARRSEWHHACSAAARGARHLILRIGALDARPEMIAERLLPALRSLAPSE